MPPFADADGMPGALSRRHDATVGLADTHAARH
jgi:hypothetical protein